MATPIIEVRPEDPAATRLWRTVAHLAEQFGGDRGWCLVGGLMVQLHAYEHAAQPRPTRDIDLLGDARQRPSATEKIGETLSGLGGHLADPPSTDAKLGHRWD